MAPPLLVKWRAGSYAFASGPGATVLDLKQFLERETGVPVAGQRLVGIGRAEDAQTLASLRLRPRTKVALIGDAPAVAPPEPPPAPAAEPAPVAAAAASASASAERRMFKLSAAMMAAPAPVEEAAPAGEAKEEGAEDIVARARKLARKRSRAAGDEEKQEAREEAREERTETHRSASGRTQYTVTYAVEDERRAAEAAAEAPLLQPPRPGCKVLVLDLDHTLLDFKQRRGDEALRTRPFMEQFLETVSAHYDVVLWSQTSWRWLQLKVQDLILSHRYRICLVLDKSAMFRVRTTKRDKTKEHAVKPLRYVWAKHPEWTQANTIHIDDLERNAVLNAPQLALVTPFYHDREGAATDAELKMLALYLVLAAAQGVDVGAENRLWKGYAGRRPLRLEDLLNLE